jgi:hypothetical protein
MHSKSPASAPAPGSSPPAPPPHHSTSPTAGAIAGTASASPGRLVTPSPEPTSHTTPPPANPSHLTDSDSGKTIHIAVGQQVNVELSDGSYDQPQSSSAVMRRTSASGGYPTAQPARATFVATASGTADLSAATDYACLHTNPRCEIAQREWIVHVVVE